MIAKRSLSLLVLLASLVTSTCSVASPRVNLRPQLRGLYLDFGAGMGAFKQTGGAPPLCCGERDNWAAVGPSFRFELGYRFNRWVRLGVETRYAYLLRHGSGFETDVRLHLPQLMLWCDAIIPTGRFVALRLGLGVGGSFAVGHFDDGTTLKNKRQSYLTVAGRFGVEFRYPPTLGERLAFGLFGSVDGQLIFDLGFSAHFAVMIYGLP